ncbi:MAG TPA: helix-turn-helix transcriptional regulator [Solirubrobacterales bacterium]|nr:helix-turn-helix transcriptional regulator [Solirubrobacterales bacterium]
MPSRSPQDGELHSALGKAIRELRERQGLTQEELASRANLHGTDISSLEGGRRNPTLKALERVSKGLGVATSELLVLAEVLKKTSAPPRRP